MEQDLAEKQLGPGLLMFIFWMLVQVIIIVFLEGAGLLPSRIGAALGWEPLHIIMHHGYDFYTELCFYIGIAYTGVGCILLTMHGINTPKWWKAFLLCYFVYVLLTAVFGLEIGSLILDIWFAPIIWLGELELVHWICTSVKEKQNEPKGATSQ